MSSELPKSQDFMAPKQEPICRACGRPADGSPVWMVAHPEWEHAACVDWTRHRFPFAWQIARLRSWARALLHGYRAVVRVGKLLSAADLNWPDGAQARLEELKVEDEKARETLRRIRDRLKDV